jgi:hypothetical protein
MVPYGPALAGRDALTLARRIAAELAETRGWNSRIVIESGRALAIVLADHHAET